MKAELQHIAIIMDGNARWAQLLGTTKNQAYKAGANNALKIIESAIEMNIKYLTLFAFSIENWGRAKNDVEALLNLFSYYFLNYIDSAQEQNICLRFIGELHLLPEKIQAQIEKLITQTKNNRGLCLSIALSYGARDEIINAVKLLIVQLISAQNNTLNVSRRTNTINSENITCDLFNSFLYTKDIPEPDLIIRTGGEQRLSNFLLWQGAYAELYFCKKLWPDFTQEDFKESIEDYYRRRRKYGK